MYDPTIGQFLSEDPLVFEGLDENLRRYVKNQPSILTDPSGLAPPKAEGTSVAIKPETGSDGLLVIYSGGLGGVDKDTAVAGLGSSVLQNGKHPIYLNSSDYRLNSTVCPGAKTVAAKAKSHDTVRVALVGYSAGAVTALKHAKLYVDEIRKSGKDAKVLVILIDPIWTGDKQNVLQKPGQSGVIPNTYFKDEVSVIYIRQQPSNSLTLGGATPGDGMTFMTLSQKVHAEWKRFMSQNTKLDEHTAIDDFLVAPEGCSFMDKLLNDSKKPYLFSPYKTKPSSLEDLSGGLPAAINNFLTHGQIYKPKM